MASTSSSTQLKKWDAFISFRGKDIRYGLLSHLSKALKQKQINAFIDDELDKGEEISQALLETIEESYVSVVIFSENYADSPWCLDELVKIVECREKSGHVVLPAFFKVDPTDVQELRGSFGNAFHKLKEELKDCLSIEGVLRWTHALMVTSNLNGWDSKNIKSEAELVEEIVKCVLEKLSQMPLNDSYSNELVGIDLRVKKVESLLQIGLENDNRTIGIWGMGGIGKTTIADAIFNRNMAQFDSYCFIMNVTEEIKNQTPIMLREKIISQLLGENGSVKNTSYLPFTLKRRLQMKKVIIVFDDVNDPHYLKFLVGECDLFNKGSRIIVTSRDRQVLKSVCPTKYIYDVEKLSGQEALRLFCLHAFKQDHPREGYWALSRKVITYAQGNPLAIIVLGSNLYDKSSEEWESELKKLKNITDMKIQKVLKIGYDGLDRNEKSLFLDIACFFKGYHMCYIERILEGCGFFPKIGISCLVDKSIISISVDGSVNMHELLQQLGRDVVYEECRQPGGRSRLWNHEDISHVLTKDKGTEKVEGILLNMSESGDIEVSSTAFKEMYKLRFLKFHYSWFRKGKLLFPNGLEFLPEELRYIVWEDYPLESLPLKFCPNNLVELLMPCSQLKELWEGDNKKLPNLKIMDLSDSQHLIRIPDLSGALNLEVLRLIGCKTLVEIPSSIQYLSKLTDLLLVGCTNLCCLPSCLHLKNLKYLSLAGCSKLRECPDIPCNIKRLILDEIAIEGLPSSIENCSQLVCLSLEHCTRLVSLPQSICNLKFLKLLLLMGCSNLKELPYNLGYLESLLSLDLKGSGVQTLPSSTNQLRKLEQFFCRGCNGLIKLPLLTGLSCLSFLDLGNCGILEIPDSIGSLVSLERLYLDANNFESLPTSINQLSKLKELDLTDCKRLRDLPVLPCSKEIVVSNCYSLKLVSTPFLDHPSWPRELYFCNCINLDSKTIMKHILMERHLVKQEFFSVCIPGVDVPQWMRYRNENGSSLPNIRLDDSRIIGFSLCTVVDPIKFNCWCDVKCGVDFKDESGYSCNSDMFFFSNNWVYYYLDMQHVFVWYSNVECKERFTEASFQFYIKGADGVDNKWIMKCGVHPVYEDDCVARGKKRMRNDDHKENDCVCRH